MAFRLIILGNLFLQDYTSNETDLSIRPIDSFPDCNPLQEKNIYSNMRGLAIHFRQIVTQPQDRPFNRKGSFLRFGTFARVNHLQYFKIYSEKFFPKLEFEPTSIWNTIVYACEQILLDLSSFSERIIKESFSEQFILMKFIFDFQELYSDRDEHVFCQ